VKQARNDDDDDDEKLQRDVDKSRLVVAERAKFAFANPAGK